MCHDLITRWACGHEGNSRTSYCGKPFPECDRYGKEVIQIERPCFFCKQARFCASSSGYEGSGLADILDDLDEAECPEILEDILEKHCFKDEDEDDTGAWKVEDGPIRPARMKMRRREIHTYHPRKPFPKRCVWGKAIEICPFRKNKLTGVKLSSAYANWMWGWQRRLEREAYNPVEGLPLNRFRELSLMGAELPGKWRVKGWSP